MIRPASLPRYAFALLGLAAARLAAQTPSLVMIYKYADLDQTSRTATAGAEYGFGAMVTFPGTVAASTTVTLAGGATVVVPRYAADEYFLDQYYTTAAALDRALPDGNYVVTVAGGGIQTSTLVSLPSTANFTPSLFTNFDELQAWPSTTVRFAWQPIVGATSIDSLSFTVKRANGTTLYQSAEYGTAAALAATTTSIDVPNLPMNETLYATLTYLRFNYSYANSGATIAMGGRSFSVRTTLKLVPSKPVITSQPRSQTVTAGSTVALAAEISGTGISYQWRRNGVPIANATQSTLILPNVTTAAAGFYTLDATNSAGTVTTDAVSLVVQEVPPSRITNLAIRTRAGTGSQTLIVGFAIGPGGRAGSEPVLIRGVGPTLAGFNVPGVLTDPKLEVYSGATKIFENDDWAGNAQVTSVGRDVGAFAFAGATSKDAALYNGGFAIGDYSVQLTGAAGTTGVALAEIYDATPSTANLATAARLTNVSARSQVGTGADILIAGFSISGTASKTILIRGIGPTLGVFGVAGALVDPKLELYSGTTKLYENDDWAGGAALSTAFTNSGAFPISNTSKDAALLVTLTPGSYTVQVSGVGNTTGIALVELYEVP